MKYAVGYLKRTSNLGDDIWAYSAMKLLPHCDYAIDYRCIEKITNAQTTDYERQSLLETKAIQNGILTWLNNEFAPKSEQTQKQLSNDIVTDEQDQLSDVDSTLKQERMDIITDQIHTIATSQLIFYSKAYAFYKKHIDNGKHDILKGVAVRLKKCLHYFKHTTQHNK